MTGVVLRTENRQLSCCCPDHTRTALELFSSVIQASSWSTNVLFLLMGSLLDEAGAKLLAEYNSD